MMKKMIPICAASMVVLTGCIWPAVEGAPVFGVPYDLPIAAQPKYDYEHYQNFNIEAVEVTPMGGNALAYETQASYNMQEAMRKSVIDVKKKYPSIFNDHTTFLVGAFVDVNDLNKSDKAGRISAMGLTNVIGKTAQAKYIRYKRDMITVANHMVAPTVQATKAAEIFNSEVIVMGVYKVQNEDLNLRYAFYDAKTRAYLGEGFVSIPLDSKVSKFALDI
ncbi:hypothetical protein J7554_03725 [Wohlfahrtiimonas chitiniclastica]|uniref:hypothetical protein n=1 Tax=Wohlfahrtiimonas chitiniclastica TaxID=400946 RepID=UPI001BCDBEB6|nr:hypothetical protein [Wohlfahrtiimonas chitiniclastica]MBS7828230.1 hypothetical protein [Wohlfahrtiimonas chitiniclastica]